MLRVGLGNLSPLPTPDNSVLGIAGCQFLSMRVRHNPDKSASYHLIQTRAVQRDIGMAAVRILLHVVATVAVITIVILALMMAARVFA
jgi:hypothetical protein